MLVPSILPHCPRLYIVHYSHLCNSFLVTSVATAAYSRIAIIAGLPPQRVLWRVLSLACTYIFVAGPRNPHARTSAQVPCLSSRPPPRTNQQWHDSVVPPDRSFSLLSRRLRRRDPHSRAPSDSAPRTSITPVLADKPPGFPAELSISLVPIGGSRAPGHLLQSKQHAPRAKREPRHLTAWPRTETTRSMPRFVVSPPSPSPSPSLLSPCPIQRAFA